jgi:hypothetical protein
MFARLGESLASVLVAVAGGGHRSPIALEKISAVEFLTFS